MIGGAFVHPVTGEFLEATRENLERADRETRDAIGRLYRALDPLLPALAELRGPVKVPRRRDRTEVQERAVRCPACGHRYSETAA
jgi:hypothetical protein